MLPPPGVDLAFAKSRAGPSLLLQISLHHGLVQRYRSGRFGRRTAPFALFDQRQIATATGEASFRTISFAALRLAV